LTRSNAGWSGLLPEMVATDPSAIVDSLRRFVPDSESGQISAWRDSIDVLRTQGAVVLQTNPLARQFGAALEYELPREGGRRPDVVVLQNGVIVVLEFKGRDRPRRADIDQVAAYARDLAEYHEPSHGMRVVAVLVLPRRDQLWLETDGVYAVGSGRLADLLLQLGSSSSGEIPNLETWLRGEYAPLPTLVAAARLIFERQPLPFIRRAHSARVPEATDRVLEIAGIAAERKERHLVLVSGVPGAGKTLVGLQAVHATALDGLTPLARSGSATFLSGNGPLVQVLQDALSSRTFVQDMHRYIREYGIKWRDRTPPEHLIIFDEAQRAWDARKIENFYSRKLPPGSCDLTRSEPDMLIEIADRLPDWAIVVGLIGGGQEIHTGEESGIGQWVEAVERSSNSWTVHGPNSQHSIFAKGALSYEVDSLLDLDVSLRGHAAVELHRWVEAVLDEGDLAAASIIAQRLRRGAFPIYVTRDLNRAKAYVRDRFAGEPMRRYGLLASSKSKLLLDYGHDAGFQATKRLKVADWFNAPPDHPRSGCQLQDVVTEFQCQGLELDLPIVCWDRDLRWLDSSWQSPPPYRRNPLVRDPHQLRLNAYRVLLTRGREGLVLFVPPQETMDSTFEALVEAGAVDTRRERDTLAS